VSASHEAEKDERTEAAPTEAVTSNVIRGTLWSFVGSILPQTYTLVASVVLARMLGADGLGQLTFITFTASTLGTLLTLGFPNSVVRHVAEAVGAGHADEVPALYRWAWRWGLAVALLAASCLWLVALTGREPTAAWLLAGVSSAALVLHQAPSVLLIGARRWRDAMIVGTSTGLVSLIVRVVVLMNGGGIVSMVAIDAVFGLVNVLLTSLLARRALQQLSAQPRREPELIRRTIRFGLVASISVVITWVVFRRSEVFFLEYFSTPDQIAIYSIPFSLVATMLFLPQSISYVLAPTFATLFGAGEMDRMRDGFARSVRIVTLSTIVMTAYVIVVGPSAIRLFYGSEFEDSGTILRILLLSFPLVPLMTLSNGLLTSMGKQWFAAGAIAAAAAVNIGLDLVLINAFDAIGAAVANSSAQVVGSIPLVLYARREIGGLDLGGRVLPRALVVSAFASLLALPAVLVLHPLTAILVATAVFALAFLAAARVVPVLLPADAQLLSDRAGARARGLPRAVLQGVSGGRYVAARRG
jgi:O-antigen/teichoic acid export membrane protein